MKVLAVLILVISTACTSGPLAPNCDRKTGPIMADIVGTVAAGGIFIHELTSSGEGASGWRITVTWSNPNANLGLRATQLGCTQQLGCQVGTTFTASASQQMMRELSLDGRSGMRYRIEVVGDPALDQTFTLKGIFDTGVCT